ACGVSSPRGTAAACLPSGCSRSWKATWSSTPRGSSPGSTDAGAERPRREPRALKRHLSVGAYPAGRRSRAISRSKEMTVRTAVRNPLVAGVLGVVLGAAPLAALYGVAAPVAAHAQGSPPPAAVTSAQPRGGVAVMLPDFTTLVKKFGPAVVNIRVIDMSPTEGQDNPFGPNSPF